MTSNRSSLTDAKYGYDIVVSTTQRSINKTMKTYLDGLSGQYVYIIVVTIGDSEKTELLSWEEFQKRSPDTDPFDIPDGANIESNEGLNRLSDVNFQAGIRITLGIPGNFDDDKLATLPDIIQLPKSGGRTVDYRMLCADIKIAQLFYGKKGKIIWKSIAQNDVRNEAWTLTSKVDLNLQRLPVNEAELEALPEAIKQSLIEQEGSLKKVDGSMFSIQQLLFDLNNAALSSVPKIEGLDSASDAATALTKYFANSYFSALQDKGKPVLSYTVAKTEQVATLKPTDVNFWVSPLVHETDPGLRTLEYLCSTPPHMRVPAAVDFTWDWLSAEEAKQADGILAINRDTFATYLRDDMFEQARKVCFLPRLHNWISGTNVMYEAWPDFDDGNISSEIKSWISKDGNLVKISYYKKQDDEAGTKGALGAVSMSCTYNCTARATGNKIVFDSQYIVSLYTRGIVNRNRADVVKKTYTDEVELAVDDHGNLMPRKTTTQMKDESASDSTNVVANFFDDINSVFNSLSKVDFVGLKFSGTDIKQLGLFIFPGGNTWAFKDIRFSDNQDLLGSITYTNPNQ